MTKTYCLLSGFTRSTNLVDNPEDFAANWQVLAGAAAIVAGAATAPFGFGGAAKLLKANAAAQPASLLLNGYRRSADMATGIAAKQTISAFFHLPAANPAATVGLGLRDGTPTAKVYTALFNWNNGVLQPGAADPGYVSRVEKWSNGWYRAIAQFNAGANGPNLVEGNRLQTQKPAESPLPDPKANTATVGGARRYYVFVYDSDTVQQLGVECWGVHLADNEGFDDPGFARNYMVGAPRLEGFNDYGCCATAMYNTTGRWFINRTNGAGTFTVLLQGRTGGDQPWTTIATRSDADLSSNIFSETVALWPHMRAQVTALNGAVISVDLVE